MSKVDIFDPWVHKKRAKEDYGIALLNDIETNNYDAIILSVPHREFIDMGAKKIKAFGKNKHVFFDVKSVFSKNQSHLRL